MARHPVTNGHESSHQDAASRLAIEQQNAIDLLIQGKPDHEVAAAVGVARETVTRWRHENPYFVAELNRQRKALWGSAHERLRSLVHKAVDIVEKALEDGDLKAAVEVLKAVKLYGTVTSPSGPDDPELVLWQAALAWAAAEVRRDGPAVDPLQALLDENAGKEAKLAHQRAHPVPAVDLGPMTARGKRFPRASRLRARGQDASQGVTL